MPHDADDGEGAGDAHAVAEEDLDSSALGHEGKGRIADTVHVLTSRNRGWPRASDGSSRRGAHLLFQGLLIERLPRVGAKGEVVVFGRKRHVAAHLPPYAYPRWGRCAR